MLSSGFYSNVTHTTYPLYIYLQLIPLMLDIQFGLVHGRNRVSFIGRLAVIIK